MELVRLTNQMELFACKDQLIPLIEKYCERGRRVEIK
jgi:hypothetical protein